MGQVALEFSSLLADRSSGQAVDHPSWWATGRSSGTSETGRPSYSGRQDLSRARALAPLVAASPSLQAREREVLDRYAERLGEQLAEERGARADDLFPAAVASALIGIHRAVIRGFRQGLLDNEPEAALMRRMVDSATEAYDVLSAAFASADRGGSPPDGTTPRRRPSRPRPA